MTLLEFFTGFITVFENPLWDWLFGGLLVTISGSLAYAIGGYLGYSGKIGFALWLITAVAVYAVIACIIRFIMWLVSIPLGYLVGIVLHLPAFWIYLALKADYVIKTIWCCFRLKSRKWIHVVNNERR